MSKINSFARKFHRILVLIIVFLGLCMSITGLLLKFPSLTENYLKFIDLDFIRFLHNKLSVYFAVVLLAMMLTGSWMYFYPLWQERRQKRENSNSIPPKVEE